MKNVKSNILDLMTYLWVVILLFLYDNGEFNIELGLGYNSGTYQIKNDTAFLTYANPELQSKKIIIKESKLIVLGNPKQTIVRRTDNFNANESKSKQEPKAELTLPKQLRLTSRLKVIEGSTDDNINDCDGQIRKYSEMKENDCSFIIESVKYNI